MGDRNADSSFSVRGRREQARTGMCERRRFRAAVPVQPPSVRSEKQRAFGALAYRQVDRAGGASGMVTTLPPLRAMIRVRCPRSSPRCSMSAPVASETRSPFSASREMSGLHLHTGPGHHQRRRRGGIVPAGGRGTLCGRQHLRLVTVRVLYLMFVRLAGWMAGQGFPMSRVGGGAGARVGAGGGLRDSFRLTGGALALCREPTGRRPVGHWNRRLRRPPGAQPPVGEESLDELDGD
jgi:hypothetical protein